jgi:hypothetical protein
VDSEVKSAAKEFMLLWPKKKRGTDRLTMQTICLLPCTSRDSAFSADRFPHATFISTEYNSATTSNTKLNPNTGKLIALTMAHKNHLEAKSLGPEAKPCESNTRGLLQRAHIVANWPPIYIGKESDKHWGEGEDLSLLEFKTVEYRRKGYAIATDEQLERIAKVPKREFMRRGVNQHTLEKICAGKPVRASKLAECLKVLEE